MYYETQPRPEFESSAGFESKSLELLRNQLQERTYPGYPAFSDRLWLDDAEDMFEPLYLQDGPWETSEGALPSMRERERLAQIVHRHDTWGRPLHPWFDKMAYDPGIRVITGKGAYWNWGPNYTADPVVIRRDLNEPHVLVVQRKDTGLWALPGGFLDEGEDGVQAALRETQEETGVPLADFGVAGTVIYQGPVADLRVTAHAWPETTAVRFELPDTVAQQFTEPVWRGSDDALLAAWLPASELNGKLFGSHKLLIEQALE